MTTATVLECRESGAFANQVSQRERDDAVIKEAIAILARRTSRVNYERAGSPADVKRLLMLKYGEALHEQFGVIWLDVKMNVIAREIASTGTLTHCSIYPRELLRAGMRHNAAAAIFFHNHPSGSMDPSEADKRLTATLQQALALVDISVKDHLIVTGTGAYSFAEHGLI